MSLQPPISVREAIDLMDQKQLLVPALPHKFIWKNEQIVSFFDSIMLKYPIGTFLFWLISGENVHKYKFREIKTMSDENGNCDECIVHTGDLSSIVAILDGQQRLSAIYTGLKGTDPEGKELFLNLVENAKQFGLTYDFRFLSEQERDQSAEHQFWFRVSDILSFKGLPDVFSFIRNNGIQTVFATECLATLYQQVMMSYDLYYYLDCRQELEEVAPLYARLQSSSETSRGYSDLFRIKV